MNRIEKTTENLKNRKALVGYFMVGEFSKEKTLNVMKKGVECGIDIIELGFPFSDPTADGGTIQASARESLKNGTKIVDVFEIVGDFRKENQKTPIILMGYFNIILQFGEENFLKQCANFGVDGLIIVDLPIEESGYFEEMAKNYNVIIVQIVSFLTSRERFLEIQKRAKGFIYLVSTLGITGEALPMLERIKDYIAEMEPFLPIFVGFGISDAKIAKEIAQSANGIVIGSHFIKSIRQDSSLKLLGESVKEIRSSIDEL
jgi:tryptophan synthase alpha chain